MALPIVKKRLTDLILEDSSANSIGSLIDEVGKSKEAFIFYPAALEFITKEEKRQKIGEEFNRI